MPQRCYIPIRLLNMRHAILPAVFPAILPTSVATTLPLTPVAAFAAARARSISPKPKAPGSGRA